MSAEEAASAAGTGGGAQPGGVDEQELRERVEDQLRQARVGDLLLESIVAILNLSARRIAKPDERDLEQARVGIEAARATVSLLDPEPQRAVREALSELQMLYAREAGGAAGPDAAADREGAPASGPSAEGEDATPSSPGAEPSGQQTPRATEPPPRLWTPPGSGR